MTISLYQTVEDRNNPLEIVSNGPFKCNRADAWLGHGYYFWENYIDHAHWWGEKGYDKMYVICSASYDFDALYCFDLVNNYDHLHLLEELSLEIKSKINKPVLVPKLIELLKLKNLFEFDAIRAPSNEAISDPLVAMYKKGNRARLYLRPMNQICFIHKKNRLNLRNYQIIYPPHYVDGYVV